MKICVVHVNAEEVSAPYAALIDRNFQRIKRPDTELSHRFVAHLRRATDTVFAYPTLLNKVDVVERLIEADKDGFDAAMVACSGDPGVAEAQTVTSIPIVGPMEAAMHYACTFGHRFGIVTVADRSWSEYCDKLVSVAGLRDRLFGVASIATPSREAFTRGFEAPGELAQEIKQTAERLVEQGANSVVIGSAGLSVIASTAGLVQTGSGAPVFDCLSIGLKFTELKADFMRRNAMPPVSPIGFSERMSDSDVARLRKLFELS